MAYERYKSEVSLSKPEKVSLMSEYIDYYKQLIDEQGLDVLNVKIPREVFTEVLDSIGSTLNQKACELAYNDGPVKEFLEKNPLPPCMRELLPDEFRSFSLLLNALKQWVSAESQSTDRYILGGTARATCRDAVDKCIVTGEELNADSELHHPIRDGRPPILLSKRGHALIEQTKQASSTINATEDLDSEIWAKIKGIRSKSNQSWTQLKEGCFALITEGLMCRPNAKSFARLVIRETGLSAAEILDILDSRNA